VEFLVNIEVMYPPDGDAEEFERLTNAERARARELVEQGSLKRIWRVPGRRANWGIWEAADSTELHKLISSLPFFPWLEVEVRPLAQHPSDPGPRP
jgi:muconolactone D-isomerase